MAKVIINGNIVDEAEAKISATDSGFLYGAGLFETMRATNRQLAEFRLGRLFECLPFYNKLAKPFICQR